MIAYKFLRAGAVAPFSRTLWPSPENGAPGAWVRAAGELELCGNGVHACRASDLPYWLFDELWEIELEAPIRSAATHVVAAAGRLRSQVEAWGPRTAIELAAACVERTRMLGAEGFVADAELWARNAASAERFATADAAAVAYIAAHAAAVTGGAAASERERAWQASWLAERLGLRPTAA